LRDEKYSKYGDENAAFREKMKSKNKLIEELEDENSVSASMSFLFIEAIQ
jgi:hypothetical protein